MQTDIYFILWGTIIFLTGFVLSLDLATLVLVHLPSTYFLEQPRRELLIDRHPILRVALRVLKNLTGIALIAAGIMLSTPGIPGQGLLTLLIGVTLLDFPGKLRWERRFVGRPRILKSINRIRNMFGKLPLQLDQDG